MRRFLPMLGAALLAAPAPRAGAQPMAPAAAPDASRPLAPTLARTPEAIPLRPRVTRTASTNPLALPFGVASAEFERAVGPRGLAVGVGAFTSLTRDATLLNDGGSATFRSLQLKLKYYPREDGLRGFAVGLTAGVAHERELSEAFYMYEHGVEVARQETFRTRTAPTLGATLDYNWLLGRDRRFLLGLGVGARRALGVSPRARGPLTDPLVDPRLQVGIGF